MSLSIWLSGRSELERRFSKFKIKLWPYFHPKRKGKKTPLFWTHFVQMAVFHRLFVCRMHLVFFIQSLLQFSSCKYKTHLGFQTEKNELSISLSSSIFFPSTTNYNTHLQHLLKKWKTTCTRSLTIYIHYQITEFVNCLSQIYIRMSNIHTSTYKFPEKGSQTCYDLGQDHSERVLSKSTVEI